MKATKTPLALAAVLLVWTLVPGSLVSCEEKLAAGRGAPERAVSDTTLLEALLGRIGAGEYPNIHSVLVFTGNTLLVEEYFEGYDATRPHQLRSATKVVGSILVGMAIDRGLLPTEDVAVHRYFESDYEPAYGWTDEARSVRIRDLLAMTSGYDCDDLAPPAFACENAMYEADDWVQYALDLPIVHERGTHWAYNSASLILVGEAIARASGMPLAEFGDRYLFGPLGIRSFQWESSPGGHAWVGGGARAIPRDMLTIGRLMLERGMWQGRRLVPEQWIDTSTRPQADYSAGVGYGYIWQLGQFFLGGQPIPAYWASGNGGQYIVVFPEHDLVTVFTGGNYDSPLAGQPFEMLNRYILPAVLRVPAPDTVLLAPEALARLAGTYRLDFEPAATSTIDVIPGALRILTPDGEYVVLQPHSPTWFSGRSQFGIIHVVFEEDADRRIAKVTIYGRGSRFVFERE